MKRVKWKIKLLLWMEAVVVSARFTNWEIENKSPVFRWRYLLIILFVRKHETLGLDLHLQWVSFYLLCRRNNTRQPVFYSFHNKLEKPLHVSWMDIYKNGFEIHVTRALKTRAFINLYWCCWEGGVGGGGVRQVPHKCQVRREWVASSTLLK